MCVIPVNCPILCVSFQLFMEHFSMCVIHLYLLLLHICMCVIHLYLLMLHICMCVILSVLTYCGSTYKIIANQYIFCLKMLQLISNHVASYLLLKGKLEQYWRIPMRLSMGRTLLVYTHGIMDGKNFTGLFTWDYGWEEQFCSIHMGL